MTIQTFLFNLSFLNFLTELFVSSVFCLYIARKLRDMKYLKLEEYITKYAEKLRVDAEMSGYFNDGGQRKLLDKLDKYFMCLVIEKDLRPSEWHLIDQIEVGEPKEFETELNNIKA